MATQHFIENADNYDTVITDIRMRAMNGFELVRKLSGINSQLKIYMMTAFEMRKSELEKVFPSNKITSLIEKLVSMSSLLKIMES